MVSRSTPRHGRAADSPPPSIIVADDDLASAVATSARLAARGHHASTQSSGDEVLHQVRGSLTRLVVAELYIPHADGRCIVAALKEDRARIPRLRVLVHTRHMLPVDIEWALASGADTLVRKDAAPEVLILEVERLIGDET